MKPGARTRGLTRRLGSHLAGELCFIVGNLLPSRTAIPMWEIALRYNPHHIGAAANRARVLASNGNPRSWEAFERLIETVENPRDTSASDLFVTWLPGRILRAVVARVLWGRDWSELMRSANDQYLSESAGMVAQALTFAEVAASRPDKARVALDAWRSVAGDSTESAWAETEIAWAEDSTTAACLARPLALAGRFVSPLDPLRWGRRFLGTGHLEIARACSEWSRQWMPELAETWSLEGRLALLDADLDRARRCWGRATTLDPSSVQVMLLGLALEQPGADWREDPSTKLEIRTEREVELGMHLEARCRLTDPGPGWVLRVLPPAGWGLVPSVARVAFEQGEATVGLQACRPSWIAGGAWTLRFVATNVDRRFVAVERSIAVPDRRPGRVLVTVTEDHEIHEERGALSAGMLRRLFVDKSSFASTLGLPWAHMLEAGSALAMPRLAAQKAPEGASWSALLDAIVDHLANQGASGVDLQPHLHWFNDPASDRFPYHLEGDRWRANLRFLLTAPERRGDWASATPPSSGPAVPGDRLWTAARAVALVEQVGRLGDPDYRAVLWRSGLLDFGRDADDRAWSTVALLRAGLRAVSDLPKPSSPLRSHVRPAFMCSWERPYEPDPSGPLLQLPIAGNLEGDYLMGLRLLSLRAEKTLNRLRVSDGSIRPGVHLFTLLTHEKFINARGGAEEFRLDPDYGDWTMIRHHARAWTKAGAVFVRARDGVRAVIDERSWRPVAWLESETFVSSPEGPQVRYRVLVLGPQAPPATLLPLEVPVPIPVSLRPLITSARFLRDGGGVEETGRQDLTGGEVWVTWTDEPCWLELSLAKPVGPQLVQVRRSDNDRLLEFEAPGPFRQARAFVQWQALGASGTTDLLAATDSRGRAIEVVSDLDGVILFPLSFVNEKGDFQAHVKVSVSVRQPTGQSTPGSDR